MEVRQGQKPTKISEIPRDWELKPLGDIAAVSTGGTPSRSNPTYWDGDVPWVTTSEVDFGTITRAAQFITKEGLGNSAAKILPPGTLLMALYGQGKTRGKTAILGIEAATNQACAAISLNPGVSREFVFHYLASKYDAIRSLSNTGNQNNLNNAIVRSIPIYVPPLVEQSAIAAALSDVDALLDGLTRLIAKKHNLKQTCMQELLTRQSRLPGFHGKWETKTLGELGTTYGGLTGKTKSDFGTGASRYITFMNVITNVTIDSDTFGRVRVSPNESQNRVFRGDLLFNGSSETPEEVGFSAYMNMEIPDLFLNSFCFGYRLKDERQADGLFLSYYIRAKPGREAMKSLAQGSTRYNLSKAALLRASVLLPPKDEQTAIARVFSDMDAEISSLNARLTKSYALKQAMMQQLLTGKNRLANLEASHA